MPAPIESITTAALSAALDAAAQRHAAVASNIANARTEGYRPLQLAFGSKLEDARAILREGGWLDAGLVPALRGEIQPMADAVAPTDTQMAELARNAVQFQALTQAVSRHLAMLALAAGDGRK